MFKVGVVGYGLSSKVFHIPFILDDPQSFKMTAVLERSGKGEPIKDLAHKVPNLKVVTTLNDLLNVEGGIDIIVISTPPETHFEYAKTALNAGKHVVLEKPMCPSYKEALELAILAQKLGLVLAVYQNRRFDSDFRTIKALLEGCVLGKLVEYEAHFDKFRPDLRAGWKEQEDLPGGGLLFDLGSHLIDQALALFGHPKSVTGTLLFQREGTKVVDGFHVILDYTSKEVAGETDRLTVTLKAGMLIASNRPRFALYGTKGSFVKYGLDVQEPQLRDGGSLNDANYGIEPQSNRGTLRLFDGGKLLSEEKHPTMIGNYRLFYSGLANAISNKITPPIDAFLAANVIKVVEMAIKSHQEKRTIFWE